jgi:hypothetical protein
MGHQDASIDPSRMLAHLARLKVLRGPDAEAARDAGFKKRLLALKDWQSARLARTYADLAEVERYAPAVAFFLNDLYAAKDFAARDAAMARIYPTMVKLLPASTVETVGLALELDVLAEEFDQAVTRALPAGDITEARYCAAFRVAGNEPGRSRQVALVPEVGHRLDEVVKKPLIYSTLKLLRGPAKLAGLGDMQAFLERGFTAFRHMGGAEAFLDTIARREAALVKRIFSSHPSPFSALP